MSEERKCGDCDFFSPNLCAASDEPVRVRPGSIACHSFTNTKQLAETIAALEAQLRERDALIVAQGEALLAWQAGFGHRDQSINGGELPFVRWQEAVKKGATALSLTSAQALAVQEATRRVVEAAAEMGRALQAGILSDLEWQASVDGLHAALAALEKAKGGSGE